LGTDESPTRDSDPLARAPRQSITGIPRWVMLVVPFALVVLIVGVGFAIAGATSIDGGPGFASPTPRSSASSETAASETANPEASVPAEAAVSTPSDSPIPSPSASVENVRPTAAPSQSVEAGTVANGTDATVSGEGSAEITFIRDGDIAVVVGLDCSACSGPTVLTGPDRMQPFEESEGPAEGSYLVDVFSDSAPEQSLWLVADGEWTIDLMSWNDLPPTTGAVEGTGSTVVYLVDDSRSSRVMWEPASADDSFQGRMFGESEEDSFMFGDTEAFSEVIKIRRPGVLAIATDGAWKVEP
jgi:hypothetical protein